MSLIGIIVLILISYLFTISKPVSINSKLDKLLSFILMETKQVIQAKISVSLIVSIFIFFILFLQMFTFNKNVVFASFIFLFGALSSLFIGYLTIEWYKHFLSNAHNYFTSSPNSFYKTMVQKGRFIVLFVLGLMLFSFLSAYMLLDYVIQINLLGIFDYFSSLIAGLQVTNPHFNVYKNYFENRGVFGFLLLLFSVGFLVQACVIRIFGSFFASVADIATDISSHIDFDLMSDDIRNPGVIADQIGDLIKKVYSMTHIIMAFFLIVGNMGYILTASQFLDNSPHLFYHHLMSVFIIMALPLIIICIQNFIPLIKLENKPNLFISQLKIQLSGLALFSGILYVLHRSDILCSCIISNALIGSITFILMLFVLFVFFKKISQYSHSNSIFDIVFKGSVSGVFLTLIMISIFSVGLILSFILNTLFIPAATTLGVLNFIYFVSGFIAQFIYVLPHYYGLSITDNLEMMGYVSQEPDTYFERLMPYKRNDILIHTIVKTALACISIIIAISFLGYFYKRLKIVLLFTNSPLISDVAYLDLTVSKLNSLFHITLDNPEYLLGMLLGGSTVIGLLFVLLLGAYVVYQKLHSLIHSQINKLSRDTSDSLPDFSMLIKSHLSECRKWTFIMVILIFIVPIFSGILFGVSGLAGLCIVIFPIAFMIDMACSHIGHLWQYIKSSTIKRDSLSIADHDYSSQTNQVFCDNLGDLLKDLIGGTFITITLFLITLSIILIPLAIKFDLFMSLL